MTKTLKFSISSDTKEAEEEIGLSSAMENIDLNRDSILKGLAPEDEEETKTLGQKKGLQFISDTTNKITEENIYRLYMMSVCQKNFVKKYPFKA